MRRRKHGETDDALKFVIGLIFFIPLIFFWLIKVIVSSVQIANNKSTCAVAVKQGDLSVVDGLTGLQFEHYVADLLRKNGYEKVNVTKASGDFGVDIVAIKYGKCWAFQCKNYSSNLGVKPIQEVYSGAVKYSADFSVVVTNAYFTGHAAELARKLNVHLWDRDKLAELMGVALNELPSNTTSMPVKEQECTKIVPKKMIEQPKQKEELTEKIVVKPLDANGGTDMAAVLGAGKYVFGDNLPTGRFDLKVVSGNGELRIQTLMDGEWDETWICFGVEDTRAHTYHGLSLPKGKWFEVTGNVVFEISRSKMIELD